MTLASAAQRVPWMIAIAGMEGNTREEIVRGQGWGKGGFVLSRKVLGTWGVWEAMLQVFFFVGEETDLRWTKSGVGTAGVGGNQEFVATTSQRERGERDLERSRTGGGFIDKLHPTPRPLFFRSGETVLSGSLHNLHRKG